MTKTRKIFSILPVVLLLVMSGCGSLTTLSKSDSEVASQLRRYDTNCTELSRIYPGVAYDLCLLHADNHSLWSGLIMKYYLFDAVPSAAVDTLLLPLGIHNQRTKGNLLLKRPRNGVPLHQDDASS